MRTVVSIGLSPKDASSSWPISLIFRLSVPALRAAVLGSAGCAKARRGQAQTREAAANRFILVSAQAAEPSAP
jgi:hypothetical protein